MERGVSKDCWECGPTVSRLFEGQNHVFANVFLSARPVRRTVSILARAARVITASTIMKGVRALW